MSEKENNSDSTPVINNAGVAGSPHVFGYLIVWDEAGNNLSNIFGIGKNVVSIGRGSKNDIRLNARMFSRIHCTISISEIPDGLKVELKNESQQKMATRLLSKVIPHETSVELSDDTEFYLQGRQFKWLTNTDGVIETFGKPIQFIVDSDSGSQDADDSLHTSHIVEHVSPKQSGSAAGSPSPSKKRRGSINVSLELRKAAHRHSFKSAIQQPGQSQTNTTMNTVMEEDGNETESEQSEMKEPLQSSDLIIFSPEPQPSTPFSLENNDKSLIDFTSDPPTPTPVALNVTNPDESSGKSDASSQTSEKTPRTESPKRTSVRRSSRIATPESNSKLHLEPEAKTSESNLELDPKNQNMSPKLNRSSVVSPSPTKKRRGSFSLEMRTSQGRTDSDTVLALAVVEDGNKSELSNTSNSELNSSALEQSNVEEKPDHLEEIHPMEITSKASNEDLGLTSARRSSRISKVETVPTLADPNNAADSSYTEVREASETSLDSSVSLGTQNEIIGTPKASSKLNRMSTASPLESNKISSEDLTQANTRRSSRISKAETKPTPADPDNAGESSFVEIGEASDTTLDSSISLGTTNETPSKASSKINRSSTASPLKSSKVSSEDLTQANTRRSTRMSKSGTGSTPADLHSIADQSHPEISEGSKASLDSSVSLETQNETPSKASKLKTSATFSPMKKINEVSTDDIEPANTRRSSRISQVENGTQILDLNTAAETSHAEIREASETTLDSSISTGTTNETPKASSRRTRLSTASPSLTNCAGSLDATIDKPEIETLDVTSESVSEKTRKGTNRDEMDASQIASESIESDSESLDADDSLHTSNVVGHVSPRQTRSATASPSPSKKRRGSFNASLALREAAHRHSFKSASQQSGQSQTNTTMTTVMEEDGSEIEAGQSELKESFQNSPTPVSLNVSNVNESVEKSNASPRKQENAPQTLTESPKRTSVRRSSRVATPESSSKLDFGLDAKTPESNLDTDPGCVIQSPKLNRSSVVSPSPSKKRRGSFSLEMRTSQGQTDSDTVLALAVVEDGNKSELFNTYSELNLSSLEQSNVEEEREHSEDTQPMEITDKVSNEDGPTSTRRSSRISKVEAVPTLLDSLHAGKQEASKSMLDSSVTLGTQNETPARASSMLTRSSLSSPMEIINQVSSEDVRQVNNRRSSRISKAENEPKILDLNNVAESSHAEILEESETTLDFSVCLGIQNESPSNVSSNLSRLSTASNAASPYDGSLDANIAIHEDEPQVQNSEVNSESVPKKTRQVKIKTKPEMNTSQIASEPIESDTESLDADDSLHTSNVVEHVSPRQTRSATASPSPSKKRRGSFNASLALREAAHRHSFKSASQQSGQSQTNTTMTTVMEEDGSEIEAGQSELKESLQNSPTPVSLNITHPDESSEESGASPQTSEFAQTLTESPKRTSVRRSSRIATPESSSKVDSDSASKAKTPESNLKSDDDQNMSLRLNTSSVVSPSPTKKRRGSFSLEMRTSQGRTDSDTVLALAVVEDGNKSELCNTSHSDLSSSALERSNVEEKPDHLEEIHPMEITSKVSNEDLGLTSARRSSRISKAETVPTLADPNNAADSSYTEVREASETSLDSSVSLGTQNQTIGTPTASSKLNRFSTASPLESSKISSEDLTQANTRKSSRISKAETEPTPADPNNAGESSFAEIGEASDTTLDSSISLGTTNETPSKASSKINRSSTASPLKSSKVSSEDLIQANTRRSSKMSKTENEPTLVDENIAVESSKAEIREESLNSLVPIVTENEIPSITSSKLTKSSTPSPSMSNCDRSSDEIIDVAQAQNSEVIVPKKTRQAKKNFETKDEPQIEKQDVSSKSVSRKTRKGTKKNEIDTSQVPSKSVSRRTRKGKQENDDPQVQSSEINAESAPKRPRKGQKQNESKSEVNNLDSAPRKARKPVKQKEDTHQEENAEVDSKSALKRTRNGKKLAKDEPEAEKTAENIVEPTPKRTRKNVKQNEMSNSQVPSELVSKRTRRGKQANEDNTEVQTSESNSESVPRKARKPVKQNEEKQQLENSEVDSKALPKRSRNGRKQAKDEPVAEEGSENNVEPTPKTVRKNVKPNEIDSSQVPSESVSRRTRKRKQENEDVPLVQTSEVNLESAPKRQRKGKKQNENEPKEDNAEVNSESVPRKTRKAVKQNEDTQQEKNSEADSKAAPKRTRNGRKQTKGEPETEKSSENNVEPTPKRTRKNLRQKEDEAPVENSDAKSGRNLKGRKGKGQIENEEVSQVENVSSQSAPKITRKGKAQKPNVGQESAVLPSSSVKRNRGPKNSNKDKTDEAKKTDEAARSEPTTTAPTGRITRQRAATGKP